MLEIKNISKSYGSQLILDRIDLDVPLNTTLSILGKSGCGKTTLMKVIAGLVRPDSGTIMLHGKVISHLGAQQRGVLYLFQEALLFPHLNVFRNIAFGLEVRKMASGLIRDKVMRLIVELGLEGLEDRMPGELSGGQKQRVAFGRALILSPKVLLLDEPFGNLDAVTREEMQDLYLKVSAEHNITSIFVTHDVREALTVGEQFAIMEDGRLEIFHDKKAFLEDPRSGASREIQFWQEQYKHGS